jgi:hypothetical protein
VTFQRSVHPEFRAVDEPDSGFWSRDFGFWISRPALLEKPQITQISADVEFGFPPTPNQTAESDMAMPPRGLVVVQEDRR